MTTDPQAPITAAELVSLGGVDESTEPYGRHPACFKVRFGDEVVLEDRGFWLFQQHRFRTMGEIESHLRRMGLLPKPADPEGHP